MKEFLRVAVLVIVPSSTALLYSLVYGYADNPITYLRALWNPQTVFVINRSIFRHLFFLLKNFNLLYRMLRFKAPSNRQIKDLDYGTNGNLLDVYVPKEINTSSPKLPVILFIYGGGWNSGSKFYYQQLCLNLAEEYNAVVLCPDYSIYPKGQIDEQIQDITEAILWIQSNIQYFHGNKSDVNLIGHSAGAHLIFVTLLEIQRTRLRLNTLPVTPPPTDAGERSSSCLSQKLAKLVEFNFLDHYHNPTVKSIVENSDLNFTSSIVEDTDVHGSAIDWPYRSNISQNNGDSVDESSNSSFSIVNDGAESKEKVELDPATMSSEDSNGEDCEFNEPNGESLSIHAVLCSIKTIVALAGVYDLDPLYKLRIERQDEFMSQLPRVMNGVENFDKYSPHHIFQSSHRYSLPRTLFIHGQVDSVVSIEQSRKFYELLSEKDPDRHFLIDLQDTDHYSVCFDLWEENRPLYNTLVNEIKWFLQFDI